MSCGLSTRTSIRFSPRGSLPKNKNSTGDSNNSSKLMDRAVHQSSTSAHHRRVASASDKGVALAANPARERGSPPKVIGPSINVCRRLLQLVAAPVVLATDQETAAAEPADVHNREQ